MKSWMGRFLAAILDTPVSRQGSRGLRQPFSILCGGNNIHRRKIFRSIRRRLAKGRQQLGGNQRGNVMLLEAQKNRGFSRAQPCRKTPAIKKSQNFLTVLICLAENIRLSNSHPFPEAS